MSRHRWFRVEWHSNNAIELITKNMLENEFKPGASFGFRLEKARADYIDGRYIEHQKYVDEVKDPFGNIIEIPRELFTITKFRIFHALSNLEFEDPPRSIIKVVTRIASTTNFKMTIEPYEMDLRKWVRIIQKIADQVSVVELSVGNIILNRETSAGLTICGKGDVREQLKDIMREYTGTWNKLKMEGSINNNPFRCSINKNTYAQISGPGSQDILEGIRRSFSFYNRSISASS